MQQVCWPNSFLAARKLRWEFPTVSFFWWFHFSLVLRLRRTGACDILQERPVCVCSSVVVATTSEEVGIETTTSEICCPTTVAKRKWSIQLYIHVSERKKYVSCQMASVSLVVMLFIHFFFLILTSLLHYCNILFVALLATFSYEDKRLAQH